MNLQSSIITCIAVLNSRSTGSTNGSRVAAQFWVTLPFTRPCSRYAPDEATCTGQQRMETIANDTEDCNSHGGLCLATNGTANEAVRIPTHRRRQTMIQDRLTAVVSQGTSTQNERNGTRTKATRKTGGMSIRTRAHAVTKVSSCGDKRMFSHNW